MKRDFVVGAGHVAVVDQRLEHRRGSRVHVDRHARGAARGFFLGPGPGGRGRFLAAGHLTLRRGSFAGRRGRLVAPAWKTFMTAALSGVSPGEIADIPGIPSLPTQLADRQRLLSLTGTDPSATEQQTDTSVMSDATRAII